jgi:hypothetical protein
MVRRFRETPTIFMNAPIQYTFNVLKMRLDIEVFQDPANTLGN